MPRPDAVPPEEVPASDQAALSQHAWPVRSSFALAWVVVLVILPVALWHRVLGDILGSFHWSLSYATAELSPWFLLLAGIAFLVPVAVSAGRDPESRLYPRARRAYFGWGVVLYVLGCLLAVQVVDVWSYAH